jgi:hypothetical protein
VDLPATRRAVAESRRITALALALALAMAAGCTSIRPIVAGTAPELERREGILVVHLRTAVPIRKLTLSGATVGSDLAPGEHLYLIAVSAGEHRWSSIVIPAGEDAVPFRMGRHDAWTLHVEAGRTNYPGLLVFGGTTRQNGVELSVRRLNRSAFALRRLRSEFPDVVGRYPLVYGGNTRDDFLDYFSRNFPIDRAGDAEGAPR